MPFPQARCDLPASKQLHAQQGEDHDEEEKEEEQADNRLHGAHQ